jgi:hypothetical protein
MELDKSLKFKLHDMVCNFRMINEADVNQYYVDGLKKQNKYIENIPTNVSITRQKNYIKNTLKSKKDTICGLLFNDALVGTAGIQLSFSESFLKDITTDVDEIATVGIFVFNNKYRGIGLGKVLIWAATYLFHYCIKTEWFGAGMGKENIPSYKSFLSCGYQEVLNEDKYYKVMINISDLKKPKFVKEEMIK